MEKELSRQEKMAIIFKQHPEVSEFHVTADDQAFYTASDANNHAHGLENKEVELVKRSAVLQPVKVVTSIDEPDERSVLFAELEALGGTAPKNISTDKLKAKVAAVQEAKQANIGEGGKNAEDK